MVVKGDEGIANKVVYYVEGWMVDVDVEAHGLVVGAER